MHVYACLYFHFIEAHNDAFKVHFSGFHFYTISQTLIACTGLHLLFIYLFKSSLKYRVGTFSFETALQWRPVGKYKIHRNNHMRNRIDERKYVIPHAKINDEINTNYKIFIVGKMLISY